jgi:hypothetical protein
VCAALTDADARIAFVNENLLMARAMIHDGYECVHAHSF